MGFMEQSEFLMVASTKRAQYYSLLPRGLYTRLLASLANSESFYSLLLLFVLHPVLCHPRLAAITVSLSLSLFCKPDTLYVVLNTVHSTAISTYEYPVLPFHPSLMETLFWVLPWRPPLSKGPCMGLEVIRTLYLYSDNVLLK